MNTLGMVLSAFVVVGLGFAPLDVAMAQANNGGCTLEQIGGTTRHIVHCRGGLSIVAESGAQYSLRDRNRDGRVDGVRLGGKALLLDLPDAPSATGFQVTTPQAIAAVRGTQWAVDVQAGRTSVFVVRGSVAVRRPSGGSSVTLSAGDGVDVDDGATALVVKRWPARRVAALMARFGQ